MPAIAGMIHSQPEDMRLAEAMSELLAHRAPQSGSVLWFNGNFTPRLQTSPLPSTAPVMAEVALVQRPAASLESATDPRQRYWVSFDGALYNADALRAELHVEGNDAQLAIAAWDAWGGECFNRLNGAWAMAIYDREKRALILSRDRFGIRPLYYWVNRNKLVFASEIKALFALPDIRPRMERQVMADFLHHGTPDLGTQNFYSHITALPAAHYAVLPLDAPLPVKPVRYWQVSSEPAHLGDDAAASRFGELLRDAVALRAGRATGPIGAGFTGGVASAAVAATLRRHLPADILLNSFTAHFPPEQDERTWLTLLNSVAHSLTNSVNPLPEEMMVDLDTLLWHQEMPFAHPATYTEWCVLRTAFEAQVPTLLTATGADEMFGIAPPAETARRGWLNRNTPERALERLMPETLANPPAAASLTPPLQSEDRNSAAFAISTHAPLLDHRLVELIATLSPAQRTNLATLRRAFRDTLPEPLLNREGHGSYSAPLQSWMQTTILPAFMQDIKQARLPLVPAIDGGALRELVTRQLARPDAALTPLLFRLFIANRWMLRFHVAPLV